MRPRLIASEIEDTADKTSIEGTASMRPRLIASEIVENLKARIRAVYPLQ